MTSRPTLPTAVNFTDSGQLYRQRSTLQTAVEPLDFRPQKAAAPRASPAAHAPSLDGARRAGAGAVTGRLWGGGEGRGVSS
jgi:hypothetical protein